MKNKLTYLQPNFITAQKKKVGQEAQEPLVADRDHFVPLWATFLKQAAKRYNLQLFNM